MIYVRAEWRKIQVLLFCKRFNGVDCIRMKEQLLLLLRVSKPEYNSTLYKDYKLYMNDQFLYKKVGLSKGQYDEKEGMIAKDNIKLLYSADDRKTWKELPVIHSLHKNNNAYIYCMYGVKYDPANYRPETNTYYHFIPWEYIKDFWQESSLEMIIVKNTSVFIQAFKEAALQRNDNYAYGKVHYDLDEKMDDITYFGKALKNHFESVFHKQKNPYEIQNEIRFAIVDQKQPSFIELQLDKKNELCFDIVPLEKGKGILIELNNLEFNQDKTFPVRFSSKIQYYVPEE